MEHKKKEPCKNECLMITKNVDRTRISGTEGRILVQNVEWNHVQVTHHTSEILQIYCIEIE